MFDKQLEDAVQKNNYTYHYPISTELFFVYFYKIFGSLVIVMSCSYFFGVGWRIYTTMYIDYEGNQMVDVFNG
jgi:hypothetical protein